MDFFEIKNSDQIRLTIASPYLNDDPSVWINALIGNELAKNVQIVIVDDGTNDNELDNKICGILKNWPGQAKRIRLEKNIGRAGARNLAIDNSDGDYILFIDADMVPADEKFLARYFEIIERKAAAVVFGGFKVKETNVDHDKLLCYDLAMRSDCQEAQIRANRGAYAVASNNLLARADLCKTQRFDSKFIGWGWEDTEWAIRVVNLGYGLLHIDNPALHFGLDSSKTMLKKYQEAGLNLAYMVKKHPFANKFLSVKTARVIGQLPFHKLLRPIAKFVTLDELNIIPVFMRRMAIKFWRASWAAEQIKVI
jgi:glycosyltransferase involved in cell wall biosynthesis